VFAPGLFGTKFVRMQGCSLRPLCTPQLDAIFHCVINNALRAQHRVRALRGWGDLHVAPVVSPALARTPPVSANSAMLQTTADQGYLLSDTPLPRFVPRHWPYSLFSPASGCVCGCSSGTPCSHRRTRDKQRLRSRCYDELETPHRFRVVISAHGCPSVKPRILQQTILLKYH